VSTKAQAILDEIKALPPHEQRQVCEEIAQLQSRHRAWEEQKAELRQLQAKFAGCGLTQALLAERAKERARG